jgi:hypothetical protein
LEVIFSNLKGVKKLDLRNNDLSPEQKDHIKSLFKDRKEEVEITFN